MRAVLDRDFTAFAAVAQPLLAADPVRTTVPGTVIRQHLDGDLTQQPGSLWIRVVDGSRPGEPTVAVAFRTPPRPLMLTPMPVPAAEAVCDGVLASRVQLNGVHGAEPECGAFARRWCDRTGATARATFPSRLFRLGELTAPSGVPGRLREATAADRDQLVAWIDAFHGEALPHERRADAASVIDSRLRRPGAVWMWVDGDGPVSMLWIGPAVAGVVRLSGVFTPPELRGRGYASGCVAAVSGRVLAAGHECVLYTDLANPTSNKIYQALGYRPVMDVVNWSFE